MSHHRLQMVMLLLLLLIAPVTLAAPPALAAPAPAWAARVQREPPSFSYPIGWPNRPPGDGFFIRHGYDAENTWYNPGYWHTGEDWYAVDGGETAGAGIYAVAAGSVVYASSNYPGRVVIVEHAGGLFSMYGHLSFSLRVRPGQTVTRGQQLGTVLKRGDRVPSHLHFEMRTFLTTSAVNGSAPRYGFRCGVRCPPGPGYWPIRAPDLPSDLGWRNPTHVINGRAFGTIPPGARVAVATQPVSPTVALWSEPPGTPGAQMIEQLTLQAGAQFALVGAQAGPEDSRDTGAAGYQLWYQISLADGRNGWVQAAVASTFETGADGRASTVSFNFVPAVSVAP